MSGYTPTKKARKQPQQIGNKQMLWYGTEKIEQEETILPYPPRPRYFLQFQQLFYIDLIFSALWF